MGTLWSAASASVLGRDHAALRKNRQDAAASGAFGACAFGVVADGCGQGGASEVGACLSVAIAHDVLLRELSSGAPLGGVGRRVVAAIVSALADVVVHLKHANVREDFVRAHLLATVVGFAARGKDVEVFAAGDGSFAIDGAVTTLDCDNVPAYPAYELVGRRVAVMEKSFAGVSSVAVATDGVDEQSLLRTFDLRGPKLVRELVLRQRAGALADDGSIAAATLERGQPCAW